MIVMMTQRNCAEIVESPGQQVSQQVSQAMVLLVIQQVPFQVPFLSSILQSCLQRETVVLGENSGPCLSSAANRKV